MTYGLLSLAAASGAVWLLALAPACGPQTAPALWTSPQNRRSPTPPRNNFTGRKYFPQPMCGGVAAFDFDNDGKMDIFFTNGAKLPELKKTDAAYLQLPAAQQGRRHV